MRITHLLAACAVAFSSVAASLPSTEIDATPQRFIVQFDGSELPTDLEHRLTTLGVTEAVAFETINAVAVTAPAVVVERLVAQDDDIVAARAERRIELNLASSVPYIKADTATVGADVRDRKGELVRPGVDGTGQYVAVLDTGINDTHPDLYDRVAAHLNFELAWAADLLLTSEQLDTFATATGETSRTDDIGHGTHVAGTIAGTGFSAQGRGNDNKGVAPGAELVDLRIAAGPLNGLVEDTGWERNAIAAFDWLVRHHADTAFGPYGIGVNSNSWGLTGSDLVFGEPDYDPLREIIQLVDEVGIVTVFSAGNDGVEDDVRHDTVPNGLPEVISVAASCKPGAVQQDCDVDGNDIAKFSSRGPAVDIAAPGVEIVAAVAPNIIGALGKQCPDEVYQDGPICLYRGDYGNGDGDSTDPVNYAAYGSLHGTSMAAPHVAGAVALLLQANPDLTPLEVQTIIAASARDLQVRGRDIDAGWGLITVDRALEMATDLRQGDRIRKVTKGFTWEP